jgi:hypothetical protein
MFHKVTRWQPWKRSGDALHAQWSGRHNLNVANRTYTDNAGSQVKQTIWFRSRYGASRRVVFHQYLQGSPGAGRGRLSPDDNRNPGIWNASTAPRASLR